MEDRRYRCLSQEWLKLIACVAMLIDHIGAAIVIDLQVPYMAPLYYVCRMIGRIAFPIYAFLLCEGIRHTRRVDKYILRLAVGILLAEIPFDLMLFDGIYWGHQNVMVTLTLGAIMLWCMGKTQKPWLKLVCVLPFAVVAQLLKTDYGAGGIVMIAIFALFDRPLPQMVAMFLTNWQLLSSVSVKLFGVIVTIQIFAMLAMLPISLYNGKKLNYNPIVQQSYYLFYPLHMLILWVISLFV